MPPIGHASAEPAASILVIWPCYAPASAAAPSELQLIGDRLRVDARLGEAGKPSLALPGGGRPSRPRIGQPLPPVPLVALTRSRSSSAPGTVPGPAPAPGRSSPALPPDSGALRRHGPVFGLAVVQVQMTWRAVSGRCAVACPGGRPWRGPAWRAGRDRKSTR